ncbi:MAG TPA: phosphoenolpyruvate--protein phosphotransferase [Symbiobacteriaceae bacterium]|jgi:phosphoenolpyruvate-protein phosphotransferase (PTS system enzyme I)|nr:phosphoenolpyruvate--protein phosphotransferase [Symbiobacteriaceae bacterium]
MERISGIPASAGLATGPVYLIRTETVRAERTAADDPAVELQRLDDALTRAALEIEALRRRTLEKVGAEEALVFEAHALMLSDPALVDGARALIESEHVNAAWAFQSAGDEMAEMLATLDDEYLRERAADVRDVAGRVVRILLGRPAASLLGMQEPSIVVAHDLTPSETAQMDYDLILGFATDIGGPTSHTVIMARTLGIPAVVGLGNITERARHGDRCILDGGAGVVTLSPDLGALDEAARRQAAQEERKERLAALVNLPAITLDGHAVELAANIGRPAEAAAALKFGARGVGLFRTEFLYMDRPTLPTEAEQYQAYRAAVEAMAPHPVIIRTLDIGGDKQLESLPLPAEANPFLGLRALRLCLERKDLFKTQLRALLRAAAHGKLRIMYPMVQSLQELQAANSLLAEARADLVAEGVEVGTPEIGIMIEIPAAAMIADLLAPHVDFFSIGTNDLIQYTLAVDRMNERVSHLYQPFHPAVLRLIRQVCEAAHGAGKWCGMCGEMAGDPVAAPLLLGLGLDEWSMSAPSLPAVKEIMRAVSAAECADLACDLLQLSDPAEIRAGAAVFYRSRLQQP